MDIDQIAQIAGALLILIAFAGVQIDRIDPHSRVYLVLNLLGSAALAVLAAIETQWGFLLLEGVWAAVSTWALAAGLRGQRVAR